MSKTEVMFTDIPLLEFGNKYGIRGVLLTNPDNQSVVVKLPQTDNIDIDKLHIMNPTMEQWKELLFQLDVLDIQGDEKTILRKSQRNIDRKLSWKVFMRDGFKCRYCNIDYVPMTVDHVILWEEGGATVEDNLLCSCSKCNRTRGNMPYLEFLESSYYKDKASKYLTVAQKQANIDFYQKALKVPTVKVRAR